MPPAQGPSRSGSFTGQNTIKATIASDAHGRPMWAGAIRPGRQHDQTAVRTEGIDDLLDAYPEVKFLVDAGYRGPARVKIFKAGWSEILCGLWFVLVGWLVDPGGLG